MSTSTTFRVSQKEPEVFKGHKNEAVFLSIPSLKHYRRNHCTEVIQGTTFSNTCQLGNRENGFVDTVINCYNGHHNLVLRPDDVWTAIMTQLSFYLNKNAEKFRGKFVNFEGKKELVIIANEMGSLRSVSYSSLVKQMSKKIDENLVDDEVKSWILPSFSTTTDNDLVTCGVIFMSAMKKYFDYHFGLLCGIPYVTLEGTAGDWENLSQRLEKLKEYQLNQWYDILKPILEQFIRAKKGDPDVNFWDRVCSHHGGGSGPSYLSGWITAFCVFDKDGNWRGGNNQEDPEVEGEIKSDWPIIDTQDIPPGIVEVDVKIEDNGTFHHSSMFAGHLAVELLDGGKTLKPSPGWVICLKPSPEKIKKIETGLSARFPWRKSQFSTQD